MRLKGLAGIAGRIAVPLCKNFAYRLVPVVNFTRMWARPQAWVSREGMVMPEAHDFICVHMWVLAMSSPSHPPTHTSVFLAGLSASCLDVCLTAHA